MGPGEVDCESILQNKEMTKTYWEEKMMAAADGVKTHKDSTPKEQYFEEEIDNISLVECPDSLETIENVTTTCTSPKIVETVVKSCLEESVIELEIRQQEERESIMDHELKNSKNEQDDDVPVQPVLFRQLVSDDAVTSPSSVTENRIALELREMQEREEELRQLRQHRESVGGGAVVELPNDTFQSIPTTDEGNFSEYGSEEKELSLDGGNSGSSRMMSPEVPVVQGGFIHQRTQSMDSMSSGHSSGSSGLASQQQQAEHTLTSRRRITVKPLTEPEEEDVPVYIRKRMNETPIEREIRLAAEREEELRRQQSITSVPTTPVTPSATSGKWQSGPRLSGLVNDSRDVQHRIATSRIQQEIQEATQREKELLAAGKIQTISEDRVDSKVTRFTELAEYAIAEKDRKNQTACTVETVSSSEEDTQAIPENNEKKDIPKVFNRRHTASPALNLTLTTGNSAPAIKSAIKSPISPSAAARWRKFEPTQGQRGLMQRFLASKGRLVGMSPFIAPASNSNSPYTARSITSSPTSISYPIFPEKVTIEKSNPAPKIDIKALAVETNEMRPEQPARAPPQRKGYMSAEEKIQEELIEMKKREDELRLQRAHLFAQSQPNLLSLLDDSATSETSLSSSHDEDNVITASLRSTISNPNLLDSDDSLSVTDSSSYQGKTSQKTIRKRSVLIAQWESMIQQNSEC